MSWTSPSCDDVTCTLDRAKDFVVTWTGGDIGWIYLNLRVDEKSEERIGCRYPANAHQATVPSAAVTDFELTTTGTVKYGDVSLKPYSQAWVVKGKWAIDLAVGAQSTGPARLVVAQ